MEIERKFLIPKVPDNLDDYPHRDIEQGYLNTHPVIRVRRDNQTHELTYKSPGLMVREEYNLPLSQTAYEHLLTKIDGNLIQKRRYMIPFTEQLIIELDVFAGKLAPLCLAEVEFKDEKSAESFQPPDWFGEEVTFSDKYHNSTLSQL